MSFLDLVIIFNIRKAAHKLSLIFKISVKDICVLTAAVESGEVEEYNMC